MIIIMAKSRTVHGQFGEMLRNMDRGDKDWAQVDKANRNLSLNPDSSLENHVIILNDASFYFRRPPLKFLGNDSVKIENVKDTFHSAIKPVILMGQCFGLLPIEGVLNKDHTKLRFSWLNWRVFYNFFCIFGGLLFTAFCCYNTFKKHSGLGEIKDIVFYGGNVVSSCLFLRMASKWTIISKEMAKCEIECKIPELENYKTKTGKNLTVKLAICCVIVLGMAFVEHFLSVLAGISIAMDCRQNRPFLEAYFKMCFGVIFSYIDFSLWTAFYLEFINIAMTFTWNFMDLFLIVMSVVLIDRFTKFNKFLFKHMGKHMPENFWKDTREEFSNLAQLVKTVDGVINEIIFLSFANNLYFICVQLFNSLNDSDTEEDSKLKCGRSKNGLLFGYSTTIYLTFSFVFLMFRSLVVCLAAAGLHSETCKPNIVLYSVPSSSYCIEVQRFLEQVTTDMVALTGLNFFNITKGLILTIGGTIVTYELVLLQFNAGPPAINANITLNDTCGIKAPPTTIETLIPA